MTGLDPSPNRSYSSRSCSRRQSLSQNTESPGNRDPEPARRSHCSLTRGRSRAEDGSSPPPRRHYERGHPLPNSHNPEPKDAIPYRNQHLGLPSQRRHMEFTSGCSPQRRMTYSNFRHSDSQSPTSSPSPRSAYASPSRWGESRSLSRRRGSISQTQDASRVSSRHRSGNCSPTDRHDPVALPTHNRQANSSGRRTRSGSLSQSSQRHSLDSEMLYNNLTSIATSTARKGSQQNTWPSYNTESDGRYNGHYNGSNSPNSGNNSRHSRRNSGHNSGASSPRRRRDSGAQISDRSAVYSNRGSDIRKTYPQNVSERYSKASPAQLDSSHGSTHSLLGPASPRHAQSPSPVRHSSKQPTLSDLSATPRDAPNTEKNNTDRSRSTIRRGLEALILSSSDETKRPDRSASPPMTFEDYVIIADIPRTSFYAEGEETGMVRRRPQSQSPQRDYQHQPSRSSCMPDGYSEYRDSEERGRGMERGRDRRERERKHLQRDAGRPTETKVTSSRAKKGLTSPTGEECSSRRQENLAGQHLIQLNVLNFKKGWVFRLDDDEEWRKYWFVLTDSGLKYYRDALAEERDEPEGEIDLHFCTDVMEFDAEKNYGFQVHTKESVITLSAMTSKIRRNWIDILRRNIFSGNPPDQCHGSRSEVRASKASSLDVDQDESNLAPLTNQREAGEGRDREHERRLEDRTRWFQEGILCSDGVNSRWDSIELKKGTFQATDQLAEHVGRNKDIDRKWEDFERLQFGEVKSLCVDGSSNYQSTNEAEVLSLRQQREVPCLGKTEGTVGTGALVGPCGPDAPCGARLRALEQLYRENLETAEREHERQMKELHKEKERQLMDEAQAAAKIIEALKTAHRQELEKARRLVGRGEVLTESRKQSSEADVLQVQLNGLSERYSKTCAELSRLQQSSEERSTEADRTDKDIELLRKENQELQSRLTEEITLMRAFITGQTSQSPFTPFGHHEQSSSDMEVLLRAKENEIMYLQKEVSCLRKEVASLMKEKESVCERFKEVYVELSRLKGISEVETGCLREHLSLTRAAVQEQQLMSSSP